MWWSGLGSFIWIVLCVKRCPCLASTHAIDAMVSPYLLDGAERVDPSFHQRFIWIYTSSPRRVLDSIKHCGYTRRSTLGETH